MAGHAEHIKELTLAFDVFDRQPDFDPKVDTIVRVEAGKLRKRLEEYYADEGLATPLLIEIPKGAYIPQFQVRPPLAGIQQARPIAPLRSRYAIAGVAAVVLISAALLGLWRLRTPELKPVPSIAVLPFLNLSADPANEYFADGLAEELTDAICHVGGIRVASRTSAFVYKGKQADVHEIGARLGVAYLIEGSVRKQGDELIITTQLIRTDDGYHVWSGSFERHLSDVFAIQREITASIVRTLRVKLTGTEDRRLKQVHTASQEAFDLYLQGKHILNSSAPGNLDRAEHLLQLAVAADPAYAPTYVTLAQLYALASIMVPRPEAELFSKASAAIDKALALDNDLAEAHALRGSLLARHDYDWAAGERELRHAVDLNPSSSLAHYSLAHHVLAPQERWREALQENRLASELDPLNPMIAYSGSWLALLQGHFPAAIDGFRIAVAASPGDMFALGGLAIALQYKGDYREALEVQRHLQQLNPGFLNLSGVAYNEAALGNTVQARKILEQLKRAVAERQFVSPVCFAAIYMGLGDANEVFRYLELARDQHDSSLLPLARTQIPKPFRSDPRYAILLRELGLSDEQIKNNLPHPRE